MVSSSFLKKEDIFLFILSYITRSIIHLKSNSCKY
nr:MAG TPA: hypothetical protein [Caudoviricetes sp.]